jgi:hypothetical protein
MTHRCTEFLLITALLLALAAPLTADDLSGWTQLGLDPQAPSYLGAVDLQALEEAVCGFRGPIRGTVLLITNDGGAAHAVLTVAVLGITPGVPKDTVLAQVQPVHLQLPGGELLDFECGRFSYVLVLDPNVAQPTSTLTLVPSDTTATAGTCAGLLTVAAQLVVRPVGGGVAVSTPRALKLRIAGQWAVAERAVLADGESPLSLLARRENGRVVPRVEQLGDDDPDTALRFGAAGSAVAKPRDR